LFLPIQKGALDNYSLSGKDRVIIYDMKQLMETLIKEHFRDIH
jgi:hypothetical protein